MATRIDVEITSDRGDGTLTWRAAGAKQPKGVVESSLLPAGAGVGDVLRAEAEFSVDGPELVSLAHPKEAKADTIERLEVKGSGRPSEGVTTQLAGRGDRRRRSGGRGSDRGRNDSRGRGRDGRRDGRGRGGRRETLSPARVHRQAWIDSLPEQRRPVAEQLMHEGRDGVAAALDRQNRAAVDAGGEPIDTGPVLRIADELAPGLAQAAWRDQADAAIDAVDRADLGELRRTVVQGEAHTADAQCRELSNTLRTRIAARASSDQAKWSRELREAISEGRIVRALRQSGRPAQIGVPLAPDLVEQLRAGALEALSPDEEPHRWTMVVEALAASPVRRLVVPTEKPEQTDDELLDTVDRLAWRVPGVAALFGIEPRPPRRGNRRG